MSATAPARGAAEMVAIEHETIDQHDDADRVRDDVVQLARDAPAFLGHGLARTLLALGLGAAGAVLGIACSRDGGPRRSRQATSRRRYRSGVICRSKRAP